jgi:hypothetical protein
MNKQDAPARIEAKTERPAHPSRQFFPLKKKRRAVDRVRAPASLKDICATAETGRPKCARAVRYRYTPNPFQQGSTASCR